MEEKLTLDDRVLLRVKEHILNSDKAPTLVFENYISFFKQELEFNGNGILKKYPGIDAVAACLYQIIRSAGPAQKAIPVFNETGIKTLDEYVHLLSSYNFLDWRKIKVVKHYKAVLEVLKKWVIKAE